MFSLELFVAVPAALAKTLRCYILQHTICCRTLPALQTSRAAEHIACRFLDHRNTPSTPRDVYQMLQVVWYKSEQVV
jgi:hypothetical protein